MTSGWGCPHEAEGKCRKVPGQKCDPGMKGCTLSGRFLFSNSEKNVSRRLNREVDQKQHKKGPDKVG